MSDFVSADQLTVHEAARRGDIVRILELCSNMSPAHIDVRNDDGLTALHVASGSGHVEAVRAFVLLGADPAARDHNNDTVLHTAATKGHTEVVRVLIEEAGADVTSAGGCGNTPLHCAAKAGCARTVEFLVSKHPSLVDAVDSDGLTPVELAAEGGFADAVRALAVVWSHRCARALHIASSEGDLAIIHCLMHVEGSDVNVADEVGDTPLHVAADFGRGEAVRALVGFHADVAAVNLDDETPLHLALRGSHFIAVAALLRHLHVDDDLNHTEIVRSAWSAYGKPRNADSSSYLHWAAVNRAVETLKALVVATPELSIDAAADAKGMKPLHVASGSRNVEAVRALLEMGCDVNARDFNNDTALHIASSMGHTEVVRVLIEKGGADAMAQGCKGNTALHSAAKERRAGTVAFLMTWYPFALDTVNKDGLTTIELATELGYDDVVRVLALEWSDACARALHIAAFNGHEAIIRSLMRVEGSDVNARDGNGDTALHVASDQGHIEAVGALAELGADVAAVNIDNETPLHVALGSARFGAVSALLCLLGMLDAVGSERQQYWFIVRSAWDALSNTNGRLFLHWAAMNGDVAALRVLIATRVEIDFDAPVNGLSLLHIAAKQGANDPAFVRVLLERGVDCSAVCGSSEETPLHTAARHGNTSIVEALIDFGCDMSAVDGKGSTALHHAVVNHQTEVVELLLVSMVPAGISVRNKEGLTPLCIAARGGKKTDCFLKAIDVRESFVNQMLDAVALAASTCNGKIDEVEAIFILAQFGAERGHFPSSPTTFASLPNKRLHFAAAFGHSVAVAALIAGCKDDVNTADSQTFTCTPLHWAASAGHGEVVSQLIQHGAHPNPVDEYGKTPLHTAVHRGHTDAVSALVREKRVKVNAIDNQGLTPLHWAAGRLHSDLASILIREGRASIDVLDMQGREPVHHAACSLCDKMLSVLIREGGANVNTLDRDDRTPLHHAAANGNVMAISILIEEHGANVNAADAHGRTPLHDAARAGHAHAVLSLSRSYGADLNVMDRKGNTPLLWALTHGCNETSSILVREHERVDGGWLRSFV